MHHILRVSGSNRQKFIITDALSNANSNSADTLDLNKTKAEKF